jgi:integrase
MPPLPNYLYQYPQSKNFFFRIRIPSKVIAKIDHKPFTFVASLQSSNLEQSRWFSIFINSQLKKEWNLLVEYNIKDDIAKIKARNDSLDLNGFVQSLQTPMSSSVNQSYEPKNWDFRAYLKERYSLYLAMAKDAIKTERQSYFDINKFDDVKESDSKRYEEHLKDAIETGDTASSLEQLAHKSYLLSYLDDYGLFLKSEIYPDVVKSKTEALEVPLNLNSSAEDRFKEYGYGEEFLETLKIECNGKMDKHALNRFIVRHSWQEFLFKRQLLSEVKKYANSYDNFVDDEYERKDWSPAQWQQYEDIFSTFGDTLSFISGLKKSDRQTVKKQKSIKLKATFDKFITDKKKEVKPDTVKQYQISFNFFFEVLGEDYDLRQLDKKQAAKIKDAIKNKSANSEKGRDEEKIAVKTINRYLINFDAFLSWCDDEGLEVKSKLFTKLKYKITKSNTNRRRPYTQDEIRTIKEYQPSDKREAADFRDDAYWYPKIALYTGMRLNEVSELMVNDFCIEEGINYISLFDKVLKTDSSERKIPIHSKLIDLGLLDFVESRRKEKLKVLFVQSRIGKDKPNKDGWGEKVSRWYNRSCLKKVGVDKSLEAENGYMVDFHALRTTFISCCKRKGLSGYIVKQIVGHMDDDDITFGVYGSEVSTKLEAMKDVIEKIDY